MNIDELKTAWNKYDESLESDINLKLLKTASLDKIYSLTGNFRFHAIVEALISAYFVNYMAQIASEHFSVWEYSVPAIVIGLCSLFTVIWNVRSLIQISMLKYDVNIAEAQKKLERIHLQSDWNKNMLYYLIFPVVTAMLSIMGLKFLNLDLLGHLNILLYAIITGIMVIPFVIWINKKFRDKGMDSAINFLNEIRKFEEEGAV